MDNSNKELEKIKKLVELGINAMCFMFLFVIISYASVVCLLISKVDNIETTCIVQK